ncbi:cell wall-binding repeat-containing protein [Capillimicrobium parvum]|uniref:cell wall-binding repeat-containing protein n=1 Tax=Capillimicrobium parvum TaxID=2884022 RepID=UPI00216B4083|nr:cell wall-binding repeat-containing protein [Capillimicrobium parvum]
MSALLLAGALAAVASGCGKETTGPLPPPATTTVTAPVSGVAGDEPQAASDLGFPTFATKNTTRVGGADATADAAGVAQAVFPSTGPTSRPAAVVLADSENWQAALAASVFMARPIRAPLLLAHGSELPDATQAALTRLAPGGSGVLGRAQVIRVGDVPAPSGLRATAVAGDDAFDLAAAIDRVATSARGEPAPAVMIAGVDDPAYAMPAAAWAAKAGDPLLFVERDRVPQATLKALRRHDRPAIYVVGPRSQVSDGVLGALRKAGSSVTRIAGADPAKNAVAFARFSSDAFGWGIVDPGHGLVVADPRQPLAAAAASPLSSSGTYGPLLLTDDAGGLPEPLVQLLLDIQPGYEADPVRGVYNHAWLIGDEQAVTLDAQSRIDALLEISPVRDESP